MAYKPYKMKGHSLPGPNQRKSPAKHPHTETKSHGTYGHNTDTGKSVAEGGVAKPDNPNYVPPKKESPAKIAPLIAMAGKAIIGSVVSGMMKNKEDESPAKQGLLMEDEKKYGTIKEQQAANKAFVEQRAKFEKARRKSLTPEQRTKEDSTSNAQMQRLRDAMKPKTKKSPAKQKIPKEVRKAARGAKKKYIGESKELKKGNIEAIKEARDHPSPRYDKKSAREMIKGERERHRTTKKAIKTGYRKAKRMVKRGERPAYTGPATGSSA